MCRRQGNPPTSHIIEAGDTLQGIAQAYYGDLNNWRKIFEANRDIINDQNQIVPGQRLHIRALDSPSSINPNLSQIPHEWQNYARPLVPTLVSAFHDQGLDQPRILAFASASICHESSWNPQAENTTDEAARTPWSGKGLAQITYDYNYTYATEATGIDFINHPEYMFDPYKSLRAQAAFYQRNHQMIDCIQAGDYESAAGIYNRGNPTARNDYTQRVSRDTPLWLPVFQVK